MKKTVQQTMSLLMAILLLLSTTSWKVEKHYCMGLLMDMALFVDVDDCGMDMAIKEDGQNLDETKKSCCDDEVIFIAGQDDLKLSFEDLSFDPQLFLVTFIYSYSNLFKATEKKSVLNEYYPPPLLVKDIQLLDEVFLI